MERDIHTINGTALGEATSGVLDVPTNSDIKRPAKDATDRHLGIAGLACADYCEAFRRDNCNLAALSHIGRVDHGKEEQLYRKSVICYLGMPGAGKTTQVEVVRQATGSDVYHMGTFAKQSNIPGVDYRAAGASGSLIEGLDELFLDHISQDPGQMMILDGFPRSLEQLDKLQALALEKGWNITFVYMSLPENLSMQRQIDRSIREGRDSDVARFEGKVNRAINQDMAVVSALKEKNPEQIIELDGTNSIDKVTERMRQKLELGFESLQFEISVLQVVEQAMRETGIDAWPGAGLLYRPFWNGKFGPVQESTDKDVHVGRPEDVQPLLAALQRHAPDVRWSVDDRAWDTEHYYGKKSDSLASAMQTFPLIFRQGGVRLSDGKLEIMMAPGVEGDLRNGIVRLDEELLGSLSEADQRSVIQRAVGRAYKTIAEYPGLTLVGRIADEFERVYGYRPEPMVVSEEWDQIESGVVQTEYGGKIHWTHSWSTSEIATANDIVAFFDSAQKDASAPPRPAQSRLPGILEQMRQSQINEVCEAPEGYHSWLHYAAAACDDGEFREWFLNQIRSRNPVGGRDSTVGEVFSFEPFQKELERKNEGGVQKITHQGWLLDMHLKEAVLQLSTDHLFKLENANAEQQREIDNTRLAMRLALVYHDVGKLLNVNTPGAHEGAGANMFLRARPEWVNDDVAKMTAEIIRLHDVMGRLSRGICEKENSKPGDIDFDVTSMPSYKGALDPQTVRNKIAKINLPFEDAVGVVGAIWRADISSVSSLRWILPLADKLEELILLGKPSDE